MAVRIRSRRTNRPVERSGLPARSARGPARGKEASGAHGGGSERAGVFTQKPSWRGLGKLWAKDGAPRGRPERCERGGRNFRGAAVLIGSFHPPAPASRAARGRGKRRGLCGGGRERQRWERGPGERPKGGGGGWRRVAGGGRRRWLEGRRIGVAAVSSFVRNANQDPLAMPVVGAPGIFGRSWDRRVGRVGACHFAAVKSARSAAGAAATRVLGGRSPKPLGIVEAAGV